jgi:hypothetical protein
MTNYVERKIAEIGDPDFQKLAAELCKCVDWSLDQFKGKTLANLFTTIVTEGKEPNLQKILVSQILKQKVKHLAPDSVVQGGCCELANRKGKPVDNFAEKSVFALIKQCYRAVCPPKQPSQKQSKSQKNTNPKQH